MDGKKMLIPTILIALITIGLLVLVHVKGGNSGVAIQEGLTTLASVLPVLAFALVAASCLVYLVYAIAAGLIKSGASFASMVAFVTAYNLLALHRFPFELTMIGWKFLALRSASVLLLAPLAGFLAAGLAALFGKYVR
jgi:hypothetical protein